MKADSYNLNWDICGQEKASCFLQSAVKNEMLSHAYLFCGPQGLGKYKIAMELAKSVMCVSSSGDKPCGKCFSCKQMNQGSHLDLFVVERLSDDKKGKLKKDIIIDQIRDLKSRLQQGTLLNSYKVAIIPEAQYLNGPASSALLKILEEPAPKSIIILITDDISRVPRTIVSRCQKIKFNSVSSLAIEKYLIQKGKDAEEAKLLSRVACGRPGKALELARNHDKKEEYFFRISLFFQALGVNLNSRLSLVKDSIDWDADDGQDRLRADELLQDWQSLIRDILLVQNNSSELISNFHSIAQIERAGTLIKTPRLLGMLDGVSQAQKYFNQNINPKLVIENLIIKL